MLEKYPVIVFIHGESYEWNSGNPYDGSVLAAYGNIVFVSINFRLGILGKLYIYTFAHPLSALIQFYFATPLNDHPRGLKAK